MVPPNPELFVIFRSVRIPRLAAMAALIAALGLAACGRKGPLDAPPAGLADPAPVASAAPVQPQAQEERSLFGDPTQRSSATAPVAPKGQKKSIPLDVLLD